MNKSYIFILIVLIVIAGAILLMRPENGEVLPKEEEEEMSNGAAEFLKKIKVEIDEDFSAIEETSLDWSIEGEEEIIESNLSAKRIELTGASEETEKNIQTYLKDEGFKEDEYNISAGTVGWSTGYIKEKEIVCVVTTALWLDADNLPLETGERDVILTCASLEDVQMPEISKEKKIKEAFAEKYDKKISTILIEINQEAANHARGTVNFLDDEEPGNAGIFLATDINGSWEIVFDGNGSFSCKALDEYGFPENMTEGCYEPNLVE